MSRKRIDSGLHDTCLRERRMLVRSGTMPLVTDGFGDPPQFRPDASEFWETGPCRAPLTSLEERKRGECNSCRSGWEDPRNFPTDKPGLTTLEGLAGMVVTRVEFSCQDDTLQMFFHAPGTNCPERVLRIKAQSWPENGGDFLEYSIERT